MIWGKEVYRSAQLLIELHNSDAELYAALCAHAFSARGDVEGLNLWLRIGSAIHQICRQKEPNESIH
jgi:hypothetical protein